MIEQIPLPLLEIDVHPSLVSILQQDKDGGFYMSTVAQAYAVFNIVAEVIQAMMVRGNFYFVLNECVVSMLCS
jgi:hypothetical protein